jgi:hypothetical protein
MANEWSEQGGRDIHGEAGKVAGELRAEEMNQSIRWIDDPIGDG